MTRTDYIKLAEAFRFARGHAMASANVAAELSGVMAAVEYTANALQEDNPKFSRSHFIAVVTGEKQLQSRPARA